MQLAQQTLHKWARAHVGKCLNSNKHAASLYKNNATWEPETAGYLVEIDHVIIYHAQRDVSTSGR